MLLFDSTVLKVAARYAKGSRKRRFASFVGMFASAGIALGVCALIVVSSIMQGLQERLKGGILTEEPHVVVKASRSDLNELIDLPHVKALVPYISGEAMLQYDDQLIMVNLAGVDYNRLYIDQKYAESLGLAGRGSRTLSVPNHVENRRRAQNRSFESADRLSGSGMQRPQRDEQDSLRSPYEFLSDLPRGPASGAQAASGDAASDDGAAQDSRLQFVLRMPERGDALGYRYGSVFDFERGKYQLALSPQTFADLDVFNPAACPEMRLISTLNARYTPLGLSPVQRGFVACKEIRNAREGGLPRAYSHYEDVRSFFRIPSGEVHYRLYLDDPFNLSGVKKLLDGRFEYTDWTSRYGDFFKAVGLERITMSVMLCLIILVAAFNILSSLTMVVSSGLREIAVLKTLGMRNRSVVAVFFLVGMFFAVTGTAAGVILGVAVSLNATLLLRPLGVNLLGGEFPVVIDPCNIGLIVVMCLGVSALCTLYPAYYAGKTDPVKNLRGG